ncbi:DNA-directed RNA polymerase subunit omega [bacterium]|nr:DNA-directed RNA polymerase subunit omega [bacterium]
MSHEMFLAEDFYARGGGIYETIVAVARRARQLAEAQRKEMDAYLTQVGMLEDSMDEEESPLDDIAMMRSEPVLQFEKPSVLALREMISDKLEVRYPESPKPVEVVEMVETGMEMPGKLDLSAADDDEEKGAGESPISFPSKLNLND